MLFSELELDVASRIDGVGRGDIVRMLNNFMTEHPVSKTVRFVMSEELGVRSEELERPVWEIGVEYSEDRRRFALPSCIVRVKDMFINGCMVNIENPLLLMENDQMYKVKQFVAITENREVVFSFPIDENVDVASNALVVYPPYKHDAVADDFELPCPEHWYPVIRHFVLYNLYANKKYKDVDMYRDHYAEYKRAKVLLDRSVSVYREGVVQL